MVHVITIETVKMEHNDKILMSDDVISFSGRWSWFLSKILKKDLTFCYCFPRTYWELLVVMLLKVTVSMLAFTMRGGAYNYLGHWSQAAVVVIQIGMMMIPRYE